MSNCCEIMWTTCTNNKRKFEIGDNIDFEELARRSIKKTKSKNEVTELSTLPSDNDKDKDKDQGYDKEKKGDTSAIGSNNLIYYRENHIYFYTDINNTTITALQKEVQKVVDKLIEKFRAAESLEFTMKYPPIVLHINSPGGGYFQLLTS